MVRMWQRIVAVAVKRPVLFVVVVALAVRVIFALAVMVFAGGHIFQDDATYSSLAADRASGNTGDWTGYEFLLYHDTATFLRPLTWLYELFGPVVFVGQMLVACFAAVAAGATTRLAMEGLSRRWAIAAGLVVALLPSQVLFSSIILKDAAVWAVLACLAVAVALAGRLGGGRLAGAILAIAVLFGLLGELRVHTLVAAAWAAAIAAWVAPKPQRIPRGAAVLALTLLIPLYYGLGLGGFSLVTDASANLEKRRLDNAAGASTAFVKPKPSQTGGAARGRTVEPDQGVTSLQALPRGLSVMLLEPYPVPSSLQNRRLALALAENILWWPLLLLAAVGTLDVRRHLRVLAFPLLAGGAIVLLYALSEGNIGTAFRHRGEIVWVVAVLAAFGARRLHLIRERRSA